MASAPHRANMLDARFVVVGIAAELRDGSWWVTQDFLQPAGAGAAPTSADTAPGPAPAQVAPSTAPDSSGSPAPQPNRSDPSTAPAAGIDEGEVLAATASEPSVVQLSPSATAEAGRAITSAGRAITSAVPSATSSRVPAVAAAAALLVLALLAAYRMSCVSASARIRCR
jgi:hypothetical protein